MANGALQPSLFDSRDIAEITCPELYPGERLVVCRNPQLAAERARKRQGLLAATCVDAPVDASSFWSARCMRSGAVVCPASPCGRSHAAGPYGDTRIGSKSLTRARKLSVRMLVFPTRSR